MRIPFLGRLGALEWPVLIFSLLLVVIESILSLITSLLPSFVICFFEALTSSVFRLIPTSGINKISTEPELDELVREIAHTEGFVEMCKLFGYEAEEHIVKTGDDYLLGIHRIGGPKGSNWRSEPSPVPKPVVYLHHGLLMNSEIWIANIDPKRALPFILADMGYDVWLGNNRGNKYSKKHKTYSPNSTAFWNFCIDDFAIHDIPDTIKYILYIVNQPNLVYIGFSQGSAQAFATLSINPELNHKVKLFIALAPAMAPPGIQNKVVDSLTRASPSLIYLFFGRKAILKSATFWQSIMYPPLFVHTIDTSISSLFNWNCNNISYAQKMAAYPHLYSYTSVKSVVHWFQIIRSGRFHMYDDDVETVFSHEKYFYRVASFPTQNITSPVMLLYGKSDSLVDIDIMLSELPKGTAAFGFDKYEHLDMIWGDNVETLIFPYVYAALKKVGHIPINAMGEEVFNLPSAVADQKLPKIKLNQNPASILNFSSQPYAQSTYSTYNNSLMDYGNDIPYNRSHMVTTPVRRRGIKPLNGSISSSSSSSSADSTVMAHKISSSFSSSGINFGSSPPVVELTHSTKH